MYVQVYFDAHTLQIRKQDRKVRCVLISSLNTAYTSVNLQKKPGCDVASVYISIKNSYLIQH